MTTNRIAAAKEKAMTKYDIAIQIRTILDAARKEYGPTAWDEDDMESEIIALVTDE